MEVWERTVPQRIESALKNKQLGSNSFQNGDIHAAGESYISALKDIIPILEVPEENREEFDRISLQCRANLALCQLKLSQYERAVQNCSKVLLTEASNVKCLYRRGCAYNELGDLDNAKKDLDLALKLEPENKAVILEQKKLQSKFASKNHVDANIMRKYMQSETR